MEKTQSKSQIKRERLKTLSNQAQAIRETMLHKANGDIEIQRINDLTVNDIIVNQIYKNTLHNEFHSFKGWLQLGKRVKKGETAFLIWGRPRKMKAKEAADEEEKNIKFFPLAYVFSNEQVEPLKRKESA